MRCNAEWRRGRFWLSHFLHNRHVRRRVRFARTPRVSPAVRRWLGRPAPGKERAALVTLTARRCWVDPAFVQALRLMVKEESYHAELRRAALGGEPLRAHAVDPRWRLLLGVRFEWSVMLLSRIVDEPLTLSVRQAVDHPDLRAMCDQLLGDRAAHRRFLADRLTLAYADFNFLRRNLRRWRLRVMFALLLTITLAQHRALTHDLPALARRCWLDFEATLEQIVPYHRDRLMRALLRQSERPYES